MCTESRNFCAGQGEKTQKTLAVFKIFQHRAAQKAPIMCMLTIIEHALGVSILFSTEGGDLFEEK